MLEIRNVSKRYSSIPAVESVSFCARAGEVTGYLGANGSGKSTTMKMITGLIAMNSGLILFDGKPIFEEEYPPEIFGLNLPRNADVTLSHF